MLIKWEKSVDELYDAFHEDKVKLTEVLRVEYGEVSRNVFYRAVVGGQEVTYCQYTDFFSTCTNHVMEHVPVSALLADECYNQQSLEILELRSNIEKVAS